MFFMVKKKKYILPMFQKNNLNREKYVIISNGEGWYCLAVKRVSVLLRGKMSKHHSGFYCLNYFYSFITFFCNRKKT